MRFVGSVQSSVAIRLLVLRRPFFWP